MDDLNSTLSRILQDDKSVEALKSMAEQLIKSDNDTSKPESALNGIDIAKLSSTLNMLNTRPNDSRISLLLSLKPHLTEKRQKRLDSAVKLLRLYSVLPLLKETNILGGLLGD